MQDTDMIYICPVCFTVNETIEICHGHRMVRCEPGAAGDVQRRPPMNERGQLLGRAPRWFLEAVSRARQEGEFYICPTCFRVSLRVEECHGAVMVCCNVPDQLDERRRPDVDAKGRMRSRAPRWFKDAVARKRD